VSSQTLCIYHSGGIAPFFRKDRELLGCLFHSVRDVILRMFYKMNKAENFTPGFICVLHTFGRSLQWNPHIHVLISEGGVGNKTVWRPIKHFNYYLLRNSFRTALLNNPSCVKSWEDNWDILSTFFAYPPDIRKIIYTTNIIENLNRQFRQVTKNKPSFTSDESLRKILYLASKRVVGRWTQRCRNWDVVLSHLNVMFEGRTA
jgi:hypothetical protein